ncbi:alginate lyase family protein [Oceanirhabdus sp. W0125-5]|uniref:alginate lyase family protein n=1 Tax=Oceanirhabdus sp. W0125-5 TaxID=2999116 RepID=UPI0022F304D7|nr:alginate lyase family protein [Oceanirhabdus sp. W0125-5]WBW96624.1 alginate lyase family protein [Oceanirhabdus sp. W0125-5]
MSNKEEFVFKRTNPNNSSIRIANLIINDKIYLCNIWREVDLGSNLRWNENPFKDNSWQLYYHSLRMISFLVNAFEINYKLIYLKKAKWFIESWWSINSNKKSSVNRYAWNDHGTANRLINLIYFWTFYKKSPLYDDKFKEKFMLILKKHGEFLSNEKNYSKYNHGIFQDKALLEMSVLFPELDKDKKWFNKSINRLLNRLYEDITESGVHKEHSPEYQITVLRLFTTIKEFMDFYELKVLELDKILYKMQEYLSYILQDNNYVPMIGDTRAKISIGSIRSSIINQHLMYVVTNGEKGIKHENNSKVYKDGGIGIYKNNYEKENLYLFFTAAFHSTTHKHADDLSFILNINKTGYFVDGGTYNYQKNDIYRDYFRSVFAHNTVSVDDVSYEIAKYQKNKAKIKDFEITQEYKYVTGIHTLYKGIVIKRTLICLNDNTIFVHDEIISNNKHKYSQIFNVGKDVNVIIKDKNNILLESMIEDSKIELIQLDKVSDIERFSGSIKPVRAWQSFYHNEKHPINSLVFNKYGKNIEFKTLITINPKNKLLNVKINRVSDKYIYIFYYENGEKKSIEIKI